MVPQLLPQPVRMQPFISLQAAPRLATRPSPAGSRHCNGSVPGCERTAFTRAAMLSPKLHTKPRLQYRGVHVGAVTLTEGVSSDKPQLMADAALPAPPPPPAITKSDAAFLEQDGVAFVWGAEGLSLDELNDLFKKVGFPRRDPEKLLLALNNTHRTLWIRAARKSRMAREGQLLGFARATSDRALSATIWDVAVTPVWQRSGLGRGMVERLTASLVEEGIATVTLYAEPGVVALYEKLGFVKDPQGIKGLAFQSKSRAGRLLAGTAAAR